MKKNCTIILFLLLNLQIGFSQTGIEVASMTHCDNAMQSFLNTYNIPGATFAMARQGKLVYMRAFGDATLSGNNKDFIIQRAIIDDLRWLAGRQ